MRSCSNFNEGHLSWSDGRNRICCFFVVVVCIKITFNTMLKTSKMNQYGKKFLVPDRAN